MKYKKNPCDTFVCIKQQFSRLLFSYVLIDVNAANWKTKYTLRFMNSVIAFRLLIKRKAKNTSEGNKKVSSEYTGTHIMQYIFNTTIQSISLYCLRRCTCRPPAMELFRTKNAAVPLSGGATEHQWIHYIMQCSRHGKEKGRAEKAKVDS